MHVKGVYSLDKEDCREIELSGKYLSKENTKVEDVVDLKDGPEEGLEQLPDDSQNERDDQNLQPVYFQDVSREEEKDIKKSEVYVELSQPWLPATDTEDKQKYPKVDEEEMNAEWENVQLLQPEQVKDEQNDSTERKTVRNSRNRKRPQHFRPEKNTDNQSCENYDTTASPRKYEDSLGKVNNLLRTKTQKAKVRTKHVFFVLSFLALPYTGISGIEAAEPFSTDVLDELNIYMASHHGATPVLPDCLVPPILHLALLLISTSTTDTQPDHQSMMGDNGEDRPGIQADQTSHACQPRESALQPKSPEDPDRQFPDENPAVLIHRPTSGEDPHPLSRNGRYGAEGTARPNSLESSNEWHSDSLEESATGLAECLTTESPPSFYDPIGRGSHFLRITEFMTQEQNTDRGNPSSDAMEESYPEGTPTQSDQRVTNTTVPQTTAIGREQRTRSVLDLSLQPTYKKPETVLENHSGDNGTREDISSHLHQGSTGSREMPSTEGPPTTGVIRNTADPEDGIDTRDDNHSSHLRRGSAGRRETTSTDDPPKGHPDENNEDEEEEVPSGRVVLDSTHL